MGVDKTASVHIWIDDNNESGEQRFSDCREVNEIKHVTVSAYGWMQILLNMSMPKASTLDIWLQLYRMASVLQTTHKKGIPHQNHMQRKFIHKVYYGSDCARLHRKPMGWTIRLPNLKRINKNVSIWKHI